MCATLRGSSHVFLLMGGVVGSLASFLEAFLGQAEKLKIELPLTRELNLEGLEGSTIRYFSGTFFGALPESALTGLLAILACAARSMKLHRQTCGSKY